MKLVEKQTKTFKLFGFILSTNIDYLIQLSKKPAQGFVIGWLEEKIFDQFEYSHANNLETIVYKILNDMLDGNHDYTNPGKNFICEIIKHQKLNLYEFNQKYEWLSNYITVKRNQNVVNQIRPKLYDIDKMNFTEIEISILKKIIRKQIYKFQNIT